jgi:hypothetical protein
MATSTDGYTWTAVYSSFSIYGIAYGNNQWVAVGADGKTATSTNGSTWTNRSQIFFVSTDHGYTTYGTVYGIAYGNNQWVAVGANGRIAYANAN